MAWAAGQQAANFTGGAAATTVSKAFTSNVTSGNRIVVVAGSQNNAAGTQDHVVSHTGTATVDSWTSIAGPYTSTDTQPLILRIWTAQVTGTGSMTVVVTRAATGTAFMGLAMTEYSGLSTASGASAVDVVAGAVGSTSSPSSGATSATSGANELVVGGYGDIGNGKTITAGTGFGHFLTQVNGNDVAASIEDEDSGSSGTTQTATFHLNSAGTWVCAVAVFKLLPTSPPWTWQTWGLLGVDLLPPSGGGTFPVTLTVTSTTTAGMVRQIGKLLAVTSTTSPSLLKSIAKTLATTSTTTAALTTQKLKLVLLTVTSTTTVALTKQIGKLVAVTSTTSPRLTKLVGKILAVTSTTAPALTAIKAKFVTLLATTTTVPAIQRQVGKVLAVTSTTSSKLTKAISKTLAVTTTTSAALTALRAKFVTLAVTTVTSPVIRRQIGKLVAVTSSTQPAITKQISKTVVAVTTTVPSVAKRIGKQLAATAVGSAVLQAISLVNVGFPVLGPTRLLGMASNLIAGLGEVARLGGSKPNQISGSEPNRTEDG